MNNRAQGASRLLAAASLGWVFLTAPACAPGSNPFEDLGRAVLAKTGITPPLERADGLEAVQESALTLTREEEYYLGRAVAARILAIYPQYDRSDLSDYVQLVAYALSSWSPLPETFGGYHVIILDTDQINAMAAPGGFIFVSRGFLDRIPDEDALAAVLAHEITHIIEGHGIESLTAGQTDELIEELSKLAGVLSCEQVVAQSALIFSGAVDSLVEKLIESGYSREQEFEADRGAIVLLARTGYLPASLIVMLQQVQDAQGTATPGGWFSTHPDSGDRIEAANEQLAGLTAPDGTSAHRIRTVRFLRNMRRS